MEKENLQNLYLQATGQQAQSVEPLPSAASARRYSRVAGPAGSLIATEGDDIEENEAFIYLSHHFASLSLPVPEVIAVSGDCRSYMQTDLGDTSLYSLIAAADPSAGSLLEQTMRVLADFHSRASDGLDFSRCYPVGAMDRRAVMWDLNYFKYCFLKPSLDFFSEPRLEADMERLCTMLTEGIADKGVFILRDFQSRNVMVSQGRPYVIDFQGGRRGMPHYDVASFLWQARAGFPDDLRQHLIDIYVEAAGVDGAEFRRKLDLFVLFRTLQVLGAYGFRGYCQHKQAFVSSIPKAIAILRNLLSDIPEELPYLKEVLARLCALPQFKSRQALPGLTVRVSSFSYRKGVPADPTGNGGGFVFDCRAIHNPGRYDEYKHLTGRDEPVVRFLEADGEILQFLEHVYALVDAAVDRYLKRGFESLQVDFGCTGGRHRSVYSAEALARHLAARGDVNVSLCHREQDINTLITARK